MPESNLYDLNNLMNKEVSQRIIEQNYNVCLPINTSPNTYCNYLYVVFLQISLAAYLTLILGKY